MATGDTAVRLPTGWKRLLLLAAALFAGLAVAGPVPTALAATFTANSTADDPDKTPGNGLCLTEAGDCTLRAAVQDVRRT